MRRPLIALAALVVLAASPLRAEPLPVPEGLVSLETADGEALLVGAEARRDFFPLSLQFVTQQHQAFCGVASLVMVLNALRVPAPPSEVLAPFSQFDQANFFSPATEAVRPRADLEKRGMTLTQLGALAGTFGLAASVHHASDSSLDAFRKEASGALADDDDFVIVNYLRKAIGQETGGHISPLAAYDADTDSFLILDVSRYKYPPVWVRADALFAAMNTPDSDNDNRSRGYVIVGRKGS